MPNGDWLSAALFACFAQRVKSKPPDLIACKVLMEDLLAVFFFIYAIALLCQKLHEIRCYQRVRRSCGMQENL